MLPEIRHDQGIYPVPQFILERVEIDAGLPKNAHSQRAKNTCLELLLDRLA
jgi:hypothetical protein